MPKVTPCLWFERDAAKAAAFYVSLVPNSRIERVHESPTETPGAATGEVLMVEFVLGGNPFLALNGGTPAVASLAFSLSIDCADQDEVDRVWAALAEGGTPQRCGWITDRWGFSWQVVPHFMADMMNDPDRVRARRVMEAMFGMVKLDVGALRRAADAAA